MFIIYVNILHTFKHTVITKQIQIKSDSVSRMLVKKYEYLTARVIYAVSRLGGDQNRAKRTGNMGVNVIEVSGSHPF